MIFDNLWDSKVLSLLGISLFLFVLSSWKRNKGKQKGLVTSRQTAGFVFWQAIDRWVNYIVYPVVVVRFGIIRGGLIMMVATFFQNIAYVMVNNATEDDWTFMSWVTYLRDSKSHVWPLRYYRTLGLLRIQTFRPLAISVLWVVRYLFKMNIKRFNPSNTIVFLYLTVWKDSFYAINFLFGKNANLRKGKVLGLFIVSHITCNVVWAPIARVIGGVAEYIIHLFSSF